MSCGRVILIGLAVCIVAANCLAERRDGERAEPRPYRVVDTGQTHCFSDKGQLTRTPRPGEPFFGQDAFYEGAQPRYRDNGDGTVSDLNTGLMWQKTPDLNQHCLF